jgi:hypothetical protein
MTTETVYDIHVFKTNIIDEDDLARIAFILDEDARVLQWNVDRDDVDHVLRVQTDQLDCKQIEDLIKSTGFHCEELPD